MNTEIRRKKIIEILSKTDKPISASTLASQLSVSRQVIVGDVAILRACDYDIDATPRGYLLNKKYDFPFVGIIACKHNTDSIREELEIIVDYGGTCIDVSIYHAVYGEITGKLNISSRYDVNLFLEEIEKENLPLSTISGGIHLHQIGCRSEKMFNLIKDQLDEKGFIYKD